MSAFDSLYAGAYPLFASVFRVLIAYARGESAAEIYAMTGLITNNQRLEYGASLTTESREFVFAVGDLLFDGSAFLPVRGDKIIETVNGAEAVYEVAAVGGLPAWEYETSDQTLVKVRGIRVNT